VVVDLGAEPLDLFAVGEVTPARLGGDGETGRYRQPEVGHLGEVRALAAEKILQVPITLGEVVDELGHGPTTLPVSIPRLKRLPSPDS
jgi:hypothetical protein